MDDVALVVVSPGASVAEFADEPLVVSDEFCDVPSFSSVEASLPVSPPADVVVTAVVCPDATGSWIRSHGLTEKTMAPTAKAAATEATTTLTGTC